MIFEGSIDINRRPDEVFEYISNYNRHKEFTSIFIDSRVLTQGEVNVGTKAMKKANFMGRQAEAIFEITEFIPGKRLKAKIVDGPVSGEESFTLTERNHKTWLSFSVEIELPAAMQMGAMFIKPQIQKQVDKDLLKLKDILEN